ncbi:FliH/SctL family protein [Nocardioides sp. CER19]|uniref:FliH/SctL family protein n=1 Tax=Nocardioides sp. CER19 TaxID=3038538 RepID=UPI002446ED51|nr:FliH/SctL family protein [Nocardioides sp. CER19]MDH2414629.1 FliH/SctL family protein [Nocardioides sp. CER19]
MSRVTPLPLAELPRDGWTDTNALARTVLGEVAERARAEAHAQGYAVGWARGRRDAQEAAAVAAEQAEQERRAAEERRQGEHQAAVTALRQAAQQVRGLLTELCCSIEEQGTELAWAITETIVAREVSAMTDADVVRRVLAIAPGTPSATVRLHPSVAASVDAKELVDAGLVIAADPTLGEADAVVERDGAVTDLRISTAMDRLREVLS